MKRTRRKNGIETANKGEQTKRAREWWKVFEDFQLHIMGFEPEQNSFERQ